MRPADALALGRGFVRATRSRVRREASIVWRTTVEYRAELLFTAGLLAGWILTTWTVADVIASTLDTRATVVWKGSAGLLLVSLCGWRFVGALFWTGLYKATRKVDDA